MNPERKDSGLVVPMLLALAAPVAVVFTILVLHNVWWTFATYQTAICLVLPAVESRLRGRSPREHMVLLGLVEPAGTSGAYRWQALVLGAVTLLVTGGFLVLTHERFLDAGRLEATMGAWGVSSGQVVLMLAVMAILNAAAEELFWRGYLPGRVAETRPGKPSIRLSVILPAALYASYHAVTIGSLVDQTAGVVIMTGGVLGGGLIWGWLRQRTGSVWPSLLSHGGAVIGYLAVHYWLVTP